MSTGFGRFLVIVNPAAGGDPLRVADALADRCAVAGASVEILATRYPGHAERLAAGLAGAGDVVVAVGGDGTARDVASGLHRAHGQRTRPVPALLLTPGGTGNSSYLGIWGERSWSDVLDLVFAEAAPAVRWLDLAIVHESRRTVLLGAGSGLLAEALVTARSLTGSAGRQRYQQALAETIGRFKAYEGRVSVDGVQLAAGPTLMVAVGGGRYRGGGYLLLPESSLDDGLLDVCVVGGDAAPYEVAALAVNGGHLGHPAVRYARGREISIERTDGGDLVFEHDGDVDDGEGARRTVAVLPACLPVVCP